MGVEPDIMAETGLQFFGRMSASISHEIKNVLAIVNENEVVAASTHLKKRNGFHPLDPYRVYSDNMLGT